ncbi:hypothetical protein ABZ215_24550 [Amycolatopsis sp. NPDC006131]
MPRIEGLSISELTAGRDEVLDIFVKADGAKINEGNSANALRGVPLAPT